MEGLAGLYTDLVWCSAILWSAATNFVELQGQLSCCLTQESWFLKEDIRIEIQFQNIPAKQLDNQSKSLCSYVILYQFINFNLF